MTTDRRPLDIVRDAMKAWREGDLEHALSFCAEDVVWRILVDEDEATPASFVRGRESIRKRLLDLGTHFQYLAFEVRTITGKDDYVQAGCDVVSRYKPTGEVFYGTVRLVYQVRDGLIRGMQEYYDAPLLEAFKRYAASIPAPTIMSREDHRRASESLAVTRRGIEAWAAGDTNGTFATFSNDILHIVHGDPDAIPFSGLAMGRAAVSARLSSLREMFTYDYFKVLDYRVLEPDLVRVRCALSVRLDGVNESYEGTMRLIIRVEDGRITEIDETHDAPLIEAYMRFANAAARQALEAVADPAGAARAVEPLEIVRRGLDAWIAGDAEGTVAVMDERCVFVQHVPPDVTEFASAACGPQEILDRLALLRSNFEIAEYRVLSLEAMGSLVRAICRVELVARSNGEHFAGQLRLEIGVGDNRVTRIDEYHDMTLLEAYVRLAQSRDEAEASNPEIVAHATRICQLYEAGAIETALREFPVDAVYRMHISTDVFPFARDVTGPEGLRAFLGELSNVLQHSSWRALSITQTGPGEVRARCCSTSRGVTTGHELTTTYTLVFRYRGGKLVRLDEYHDTGMIEAYLRLLGRPPPGASA